MSARPLAPAIGPVRTVGTGSVLAHVDPVAVSEAARRESRNREIHLPPLSTFRWWARRTGAVNEAVLNAARHELGKERLNVLDPFAGGGTIPLVALRAGHRVHAQDLNPWAVEGMRRMLSLPTPEALTNAYQLLAQLAEPVLNAAYATTLSSGEAATLVHTYRVAVGRCGECGHEHRQFPYSLITLRYRKERKRREAFLACPEGHIFEGWTDRHSSCPQCGLDVDPWALYTPRRIVTCPACGGRERLSDRAARTGWRWEVVLVERSGAGRREFALPTRHELEQAEDHWEPSRDLGAIPDGAETRVLLRHGFYSWNDLYPSRQRAVTETLLTLAAEASEDTEVAGALRMAIIGTTEFAGHLSRWDRFYLKCNDGTAAHRFNFSTFAPELNVWGAGDVGRGTFTRRVRGMGKAATWFRENIHDPEFQIVCGDSAQIGGSPHRFDIALTDPPYHDDVHYGELSLPFRAWAELPLDELAGEAVANPTTEVNADRESYSDSLARIFRATHDALRHDGRLIFSYANHTPEAWVSLFSALQRTGFYPVGCVAVHAENETDFKKRNVNSCTEDILLELSTSLNIQPVFIREDGGDRFHSAVMRLFAEVGSLSGDWESEAINALREARRQPSSDRP